MRISLRFHAPVAFVAALILAASGSAQAQVRELPIAHWQHTSWTGREGPPVPGSHFLRGSPDGYLWLSAEGSLLRFDGVRFTVFDSTTTPELRVSGPGEFVPRFVDRHGVMWISGPGGVLITYRDGRFQHAFTHEDGIAGPFAEDDRGPIWLIAGLPQRYANGRLEPIPLPAAVPTTDIWSVRSAVDGGLWLGTRTSGLWHVSPSGEARQYGTGEIRLLLQARDGTVWALGLGLAGTARLEGDRWIPLRLPHDSIALFGRVAMEDPDGDIWFQTNAQGLVRYRDGVVDAFTPREGLSDPRVADVYAAPNGVVWVSTDAGLDRLRPATFAPLDPASIVSGGIGSTILPNVGGGMWVRSAAGNSVFLLDGGILRTGAGPLTAQEFRFDASPTLVTASHRGGLWVKVFGGDLIYLQANGTRRTTGEATGLADARVVGGIELRDGSLWIELIEGFGRLENGRYRPITIGGVEVRRANAYIEDGRGRLWLAWGDQPVLAAFDGDSLVQNVAVPSTTPIRYFAREHGDTLWAASDLALYRIVNAEVVEVPVSRLQQVLAPGAAIGIAEGYLWVASAGGIARASLVDLHRAADGDSIAVAAQVFDEMDGLEIPRAARITWRSVVVDRDGRLWINTAAGPVLANPTPRVAGSRTPPRVLIEEVTVDGVPIADGARVRPRPGRLDLHFTATGMELPERARLQYRLDGADEAWVDASIPRVATYNHLRPGNYVFRVRAQDEAGDTSAAEATLRFRVQPAWNQAWWFFALVLAAIAALAGSAVLLWQQRRSRRAAQRAQTEFDAVLADRRAQYEATLAERTRIAQDLHDTLLQGFAGVTLQLKTAELALPDEPDVAAETILRVQRLARESLREARERVWDMRRNEPDGNDLPAALEAFARECTAGTGIAVAVTAIGRRCRLTPNLEDTAFRIGREAVVNAVRHARPGRIEIDVEFGTNGLRIEVRDDGLGFTREQGEEAHRMGHFGLSGIRDRAADAGGRCDVTSEPGTGTVVTLEIPLNDSAWAPPLADDLGRPSQRSG